MWSWDLEEKLNLQKCHDIACERKDNVMCKELMGTRQLSGIIHFAPLSYRMINLQQPDALSGVLS